MSDRWQRHAPTGRVPLLLAIVALLLFTTAPVEESQLTLRLTTDEATYQVGQAIQLDLVLENDGSEPITLEFTSSQRYDFEIRNAEDELVWRWSDEMGFAQVLGSETVEPEGQLHYEEEFGQTLDSGSYRVIGYITAPDVELKDETDIIIR